MGKLLLTSLLAVAMTGFAAAQENPPRGSEDDELTPQKALERLTEAQELMKKAEEHLNDLLVEKSEQRQKAVIDLLDEVLKSARSAAASRPSKQDDPAKGDKADGSPKGGSTPAAKTYNPNRIEDAVSPFRSKPDRSSWGNMTPTLRRATLDSAKIEVPPDYLDMWKAYSEEIQKSLK